MSYPLIKTPAWHDEALCAQIGPDLWIPTVVGHSLVAPLEGKKICLSCPVRTECADEALRIHDRFTVRAGFSTHTHQGRTALREWLEAQS